ncbi:MAG: hypothetical protein AB1898_28990 [Acidobacteriota bacterium]
MNRRPLEFINLKWLKILQVWLLALSVGNLGSAKSSAPALLPGTSVEVRMIDSLDTGKNKAGEAFRASLATDLQLSGGRTVPRDSLVEGRITELVSSGRLKTPASLSLVLTRVTPRNGRSIALSTEPLTLEAKSHGLRNVVLIGGGAGAGAILGGVAAGKKGAVIGGAVGAGAGAATAYLTGKQEIAVPSETNLSFVAAQPASSVTGVASVPNSALASAAFGSDHPSRDKWDEIVFSDRDRRVIRDYFRGRYSNLPPGLAKRGGNLPPGLEKHLRKNGRLPPGLQKRVEPFPIDLTRRLPSLPERIIRIILGRRAMIVDDQNNILDLMEDIYR